MPYERLTERQAEVLAAVVGLIDEHGYPPTCQEIADAMGFRSPNAANEHLRALERRGYVRRHPRVARGLRVLRRHAEAA